MAIDLIARAKAAEATVARFDGQPFEWGRNDCLRMVAHALREIGRSPPLREAGEYRFLLGARRALKRRGHASLDKWVDTWGHVRIPSAMVMSCDVVAFSTDDPAMPALAPVLSNGRRFGFMPEVGAACVFQPKVGAQPLAAWSIA